MPQEGIIRVGFRFRRRFQCESHPLWQWRLRGWRRSAPPAVVESALAEEIWSENFCEQAVSLAKQRGESPQTLNMVSCRLLNYYQPSYWQCVIAAMKADAGMKLDAAPAKSVWLSIDEGPARAIRERFRRNLSCVISN